MPQDKEAKRYAVIETGGKQHLVAEGEVIEIEKIPDKTAVTFNEVLLVVDGEKVSVGQPYVKGAKVKAKVLDQFKGKKVKGFKYIYKMKYGKRYGHRQELTRVEVEEIVG